MSATFHVVMGVARVVGLAAVGEVMKQNHSVKILHLDAIRAAEMAVEAAVECLQVRSI